VEKKTIVKWNGRRHLEYRYGWYNGVEPREEEPALSVNYLTMEIWNRGKGKVTYRNNWVTDLAIDKKNVGELAA
jgi:predicted NAD/FAD-binding protein